MLPSLCTVEQCYHHCTHIYLGPTQLLDKQLPNFHNTLSDNVRRHYTSWYNRLSGPYTLWDSVMVILHTDGQISCPVTTYSGTVLLLLHTAGQHFFHYTQWDNSFMLSSGQIVGQLCRHYTRRDNVVFMTHCGTTCRHLCTMWEICCHIYTQWIICCHRYTLWDNMLPSLHTVGQYVVIFTH